MKYITLFYLSLTILYAFHGANADLKVIVEDKIHEFPSQPRLTVGDLRQKLDIPGTGPNHRLAIGMKGLLRDCDIVTCDYLDFGFPSYGVRENGYNGRDGRTGPRGATGVAGPAGVDGAIGAPGATGPQGANGTNGVDDFAYSSMYFGNNFTSTAEQTFTPVNVSIIWDATDTVGPVLNLPTFIVSDLMVIQKDGIYVSEVGISFNVSAMTGATSGGLMITMLVNGVESTSEQAIITIDLTDPTTTYNIYTTSLYQLTAGTTMSVVGMFVIPDPGSVTIQTRSMNVNLELISELP